MALFAALLVLTLLCISVAKTAPQPSNILIILLDDVDDLPVTRSQGIPSVTKFFQSNGILYDNAFVTTPICCPSRASIYTGTYQHNHRTLDNTVKNGCDGPNWDERIAPNSIGARLQALGYRTAMFGKYSNNYKGDKVPAGWNRWLGLLGNSAYYNYTLNKDGVNEKHGVDYEKDYLPKIIIEEGIKFMTSNESAPWCAFLSFPTAHEPFDAAPQHQQLFNNSSPASTKYPSYNHTGDTGKHWYTRSRPPLTKYSARYNQLGWQRRLQALQSVDEGFTKILSSIDSENTTIIFTSDNGFYFGEFGMILDKRQPYEITVRVPMFASGPHFPKGASTDAVVLNIDIAPTALDVARRSGAKETAPTEFSLPFDGVSLVSQLAQGKDRSSFLIEYHGMGNGVDSNDSCSHINMRCWYKDSDVWRTEPKFDIPAGEKFCFCVDSKNNTFSCERRISSDGIRGVEGLLGLGGNHGVNHPGNHGDTLSRLTERRVDEYLGQTSANKVAGTALGAYVGDYTNYLYCHFSSGWNEFYDMHLDPFQMQNRWGDLSEEIKYELQYRVKKLERCRGETECAVLDNVASIMA